jgi:hypothetical protein
VEEVAKSSGDWGNWRCCRIQSLFENDTLQPDQRMSAGRTVATVPAGSGVHRKGRRNESHFVQLLLMPSRRFASRVADSSNTMRDLRTRIGESGSACVN